MKARALLIGVFLPALSSAQGYHFAVGQELRYRLDYTNVTVTDARALFSDQAARGPDLLSQTIESKVRADLIRTTVRQSDSTWVVSWTFRNADVGLNSGGNQEPLTSATIARELELPIMMRVTTSGAIKEIWFDGSTGILTRSFGQSILSALQFVVPPGHSRAWETAERDPAGTYTARYTTSTPGEYKRSKLSYKEVEVSRPGQTGMRAITTPQGSVNGKVKNGILTSLSGVDSVAVAFNTRRIAHGFTRVNLSFITSGIAKPADMAELSARSYGARPATPVIDDDRAIHQTELGNRTAESLMDELAARERAYVDTSSTTPLYLKFKALAYLFPNKSAELGVILSTARAGGPTMEVLSSALSAAGYPESQQALIVAMQRRESDWPVMAALIPSLGSVKTPVREAVDYMRHIAFESANPDIASTARLALGTMANRLGSDQGSMALQVVNELGQKLRTATTIGDQSSYILALGNAAAPEALILIERYATDSSVVLRANTMTALRWIPGDKPRSILEKALQDDPDPTVREAARRALNDRGKQ